MDKSRLARLLDLRGVPSAGLAIVTVLAGVGMGLIYLAIFAFLGLLQQIWCLTPTLAFFLLAWAVIWQYRKIVHQYRLAKPLWDNFYYCALDDVVFNSDDGAVFSPEHMWEYLEEETGSSMKQLRQGL